MSEDKPKRLQKKQKGPKNNQGKGKGKANWSTNYPQGYRIHKLEPSAMESVLNMARTIMEFTAKEKERMKRTFTCKKYNKIQFVETSIDVELGKFDEKLNKITSDINDLKRNDRTSSEWHKLKTARLESISNTCDRIESKYKVQDDRMEDLSIANINDKLTIL
ncbi:hypothetical protein O181_003825 [Austropuccinia psidii MF-1]|uniref:Uncharacterized protein n=1 Tax=Austropuccinia psidii MF-1 TaxID=1389203 RepID=A0A9Q3GEA3_9BASI|nr:hypothetical protein [Austropuccinia psidii MF-1]